MQFWIAMRNLLLRLLAGKSPIALNLTIAGGELRMHVDDYGYVYNCVFLGIEPLGGCDDGGRAGSVASSSAALGQTAAVRVYVIDA